MSTPARAALLFLLCMAVYNANLRFTGSNDSLASSILPFQIWRGEGLDLTAWATELPPQVGYSMIPSRRGGWVSAYPLTTPLVVLPLYSPAAVWSRFHPRDPAYGNLIRVVMEKFSASVVASLSVVFVFLILNRLYKPGTVTLLTIAYAFGTSVWAISSQALWQHGVAQLLIAAAVYILITDPEPHGRRAFLLGLLAGLVTANRPPDLFFSVAIAWIVTRRSGRRAWPFFAAAFAVGALLLLYNATTFPTILGGYAEMRTNHNMGVPLRMEWPRPDRLAGLFFSNRGLFFFFPFLLVLAFLPKPRGRAREEAIVFGAAFLSSAIFYASFFWWPAGYCYGPRYLTDALPWLFVYVGAAVDALRTSWSRLAVATAVAYSVFLQFIGAFCYPGGDSGATRHGFWTIARSSPVLALQSGLQSPYFVYEPNPRPAASAVTKTTFRQPVPATWRTGETRLLRVTVRNEGTRSVSSVGGLFAVGAVRLLVRWQPVSRQTDNWLAWDLDPGESKDKQVFVRAPSEAGDYVLTIEPAQYEGGRLVPFSEHGSPPAVARVRVVDER